MMKNGLLAFMMFCCIGGTIVSCKKKDESVTPTTESNTDNDDPTGEGDGNEMPTATMGDGEYYPFYEGNYWSQKSTIDYTDTVTEITTSGTEKTITLTSGNGGTTSTVKYDDGKYSFDGSVVKALTGVDFGSSDKFYVLLDEKSALNTVWDGGTHLITTPEILTYPSYDVDLNLKGKIVEKLATYEVNSVTYKDVIKVNIFTDFNVSALPSLAQTAAKTFINSKGGGLSKDFYYAKGIGPISQGSGAITLKAYSVK